MGHDVFICHAEENKAIAHQACKALEAAGVQCWIAPRNVLPGKSWAASINRAIGSSRLLLLVYSHHADSSRHVERELELADSRKIPILPFRIENIAPTDAIEYYIGAAHWLDAHTQPLEKHLDKLIRAAYQHLGVSGDAKFTRQPKQQWIGTANKPLDVFQDRLKSGRLGPKMVVVPAGHFLMGSTRETDGDERDDDEHQHEVTIDKPFAIGQYPVTNGEYRWFKPDHDSGEYHDHSLNGDDHPAVEVSWNDAVAYAKWLSEQTGKHYRLPTEAEWEYAARAGTTTRRYWGDDPGQACAYANVHDQTAKRAFNFDWPHHECDDGYAVTSPVGRFKPNDFKLYDMLGNVWEWTCSEYDENYAGAEKRCIAEGDALRSLRGGSRNDVPGFVRSANRNGVGPSGRSGSDGFRLAQDV